MKYIVIGDLHGNIDLYMKIRKKWDTEIILVGDLLDSFIFPVENQYDLVKQVVHDVQHGITRCIFGNHELSYLIPKMRCSGYNPTTDFYIQPFKKRMLDMFEPFICFPEHNILITHAGLNSQFVREYIKPEQSAHKHILSIANWLDYSFDKRGQALNIGWSRGGSDKIAGIFWSDWSQDFNPVMGITQICGHTPAKEIRKKADNWCIDCLPSTNHGHTRTPMGVMIEDGKITEIQLI